MASTTSYTTNPTLTETEGEDPTNEDGDEDVDTGAGVSPKKRIVLMKQTALLVYFIIVSLLSLSATVYVYVIHLAEYDYPPTELSETSFINALQGLISLTVVTLIGFLILKFRMGNLLIGMIYFFLLVLCIIFPVKGIAYGIASRANDDYNTIQQFVENPAIEHKLHNFWAAYQKKHSCCGTLEIDKVEDWSYYLNTTDLPATCCTKEQINYAAGLGLNSVNGPNQKAEVNPTPTKHKPELDPATSYCGRGLARTRNKGLGFNNKNKTALFKRPFSGFFLSLTQKQIPKMAQTFLDKSSRIFVHPNKMQVDQLYFRSRKIETVGADVAFMRNWKTFYLDSVCNTVDDILETDPSYNANGSDEECTLRAEDHPNDIAYPGTMSLDKEIENIGVVFNVSEAHDICTRIGWRLEAQRTGQDPDNTTEADRYCNKTVPQLKLNATTIGRELLQRLDYLTTYIYEFSEGKDKIFEGTWVLWKVPTRFDPSEIYPYKLNANYLRVSDPNDQKKAETEAKQMYYFSRGIAENYVLKTVIHEKSCELLKESYKKGFLSKLARDLNKRWRKSKPFSDWKNSEEGLGHFFLEEVHYLMYFTIGVSVADIACVIFLAVQFWQHYSRIKAEDYANLALPKEFEVLHLRRASLIDERDIVKEGKASRRRRVAPERKGASQPQRRGQQRGQRGQQPSGRVQPGPLRR